MAYVPRSGFHGREGLLLGTQFWTEGEGVVYGLLYVYYYCKTCVTN